MTVPRCFSQFSPTLFQSYLLVFVFSWLKSKDVHKDLFFPQLFNFFFLTVESKKFEGILVKYNRNFPIIKKND